jgi:hypothetical protein
MKVPKFKKVVEDGIAALQGKIVDSSNVRRFQVIDTPNNKMVLSAFGEYRWATDGKGEVIEGKPYHDKDGVSDIMDALRYPFQNLFSKNSQVRFEVGGNTTQNLQDAVSKAENNAAAAKVVNNAIMKDKINELATNSGNVTKTKKKGRIFWG